MTQRATVPSPLPWVVPWTIIIVTLLSQSSPSDAFHSCPSICICKWKNGKRWIECKDQQLISIPDKLEIETQVLDLSGNNLQILPREVFFRNGLVNLQRLHLENCKIGQIDPTAFRGLTNLVELNLAGNLLTAVPTATFADIPYLRDLKLNDNPLDKIEANAFEMIPHLVSLDLSKCQIKKIAAKAFAHLSHLEKLYLSNNSIRELRQRTVESLTGLHGIELNGNPWTCDCRLRALKEWIVMANVAHTIEPTCASPTRLEGKQFSSLSVEEYACPPDLLSAPRFVESNAGENATITCKIGSVPKSSVRWYRDGNEILNNSIANRGLQRFLIFENGTYEMHSTLILTSVKTDDSGQYKCVAANPAGKVEANFTLQVGYFVSGVASLESSEIAGIAVTFTIAAVVILVIVLLFLVRQRSCTGPLSSGASEVRLKHESAANGDPNGFVNGSRATPTLTNPVQKPPRLTELQQFTASGHVASNGSVTINGTVFHPGNNNIEVNGNRDMTYSCSNPDLIPPTSTVAPAESREDLGGFSPTGTSPGRRLASLAKVHQDQQNQLVSPSITPVRQLRHLPRPSPQHITPNVIPNLMASHTLARDGYYREHRSDFEGGADGPNMWVMDSPSRSSTAHLVPNSPAMSPMKRDLSARTLGHGNTLHHGATLGSPYRNRSLATKTLPRMMNSSPIHSGKTFTPNFAQNSSMYLSDWHGTPSDDFANPLRQYGYPSDYGLPVSAGSVTVNPMTDLMYGEQSDIVESHPSKVSSQPLNLSNSSGSSCTLSPLRSGATGQISSSGICGDASTASGTSNTLTMGFDTNDPQGALSSSGGSGGTPTPTSVSGTTRNPAAWMKSQGGVQVLPTVSPRNVAKPRLFKPVNRDSPDEGIQDDCSTDV